MGHPNRHHSRLTTHCFVFFYLHDQRISFLFCFEHFPYFIPSSLFYFLRNFPFLFVFVFFLCFYTYTHVLLSRTTLQSSPLQPRRQRLHPRLPTTFTPTPKIFLFIFSLQNTVLKLFLCFLVIAPRYFRFLFFLVLRDFIFSPRLTLFCSQYLLFPTGANGIFVCLP